MSWGTIKLRRSDILFSQYIRTLRNWKCERCRKVCKIGDERIAQLEASHYYGRRNETTRYDSVNVKALCTPCHKRMGGHTKDEDGEYDLWMKELLGAKEYRNLGIRARTTGHKDEKLAILYVKQLMKELD